MRVKWLLFCGALVPLTPTASFAFRGLKKAPGLRSALANGGAPLAIASNRAGVASTAARLPDHTITGTITNEKGQGLPGVTGSVASVPMDRLERLPVSNVAQALQGAVAGVQITSSSSVPGSQPVIQVRGVRSITANTDPYIILDGVPFPGNFNDISPTDIASIEILKDASSMAIYGTRGSNGVILVTTKHGKTGKPQGCV